jgi:anthranilate phosphoribosyltransferase
VIDKSRPGRVQFFSPDTRSLLHFPVPVTSDAALRFAIEQLAQGASLDRQASAAAFEAVMGGRASPVQIAALLMGLRAKGETPDEVAGAVLALRGAMSRFEYDDADLLVDTCGTGGGRVGTLNISTAAAFLVAGAGVGVAKHGNRSFTSRSGSADVLEALGVNINLSPGMAREALRTSGLTFLFAPTYHPAMRHAGPIRKELGISTIMNLVGPLANPAGVGRQVVGVSERSRAELIGATLAALRTKHALVVHAVIGMDEISPAGNTLVWEVRDNRVETWELEPARFGLECGDLDELVGGEPAENAARIERLLVHGEGKAIRCAVVLNAAAALYVSANDWSFEEAVGRAAGALDSGAAGRVLARLRKAAPRL